MRQTTLEFPCGWGGAREGAGRKHGLARARVEHRTRPRVVARVPVHVTLRLAAGLPSLRQPWAHHELLCALAAGAERFGFRLVHYAAMSNHVHLVCEASDERALARGMKGVCVRITRALNRAWQRKGTVFADRYHCRVLPTPSEVRAVLGYVLNNARRHGVRVRGRLDAYSSARWFDGWETSRGGTAIAGQLRAWLPDARSWLLTTGWRLLGLLDPAQSPPARRH